VQLLITGLAYSFIGLGTRTWQLWAYAGWLIMPLSYLVALAMRDPRYEPFGAVVIGWTFGTMQLGFALHFLRRRRPTPVVETSTVPVHESRVTNARSGTER
jgi:hypothetical protein